MEERLENKQLFDEMAAFFVQQVLSGMDSHVDLAHSSDAEIDHLMELEVPRVIIDDTVENNLQARHALDALDIDPDDQKKLSKIADSDYSGTITMLELVTALQRLRGTPRRSDTIS